MRRRLLAGSALFALVLLVTDVAGALDGDPPAKTGWWTSEPGAAAQPDGGFQVGALGGQAVSVAAVQFSAPSGVTSAKLTLQEASGGFVTPASSLQVCVTTASWEPANPGAMADAPAADCSQKVDLTRDADKLMWTGEVAGLMPTAGGEPSLMIVPGETAASGSPVDPGFRVTFSGAALTVVSSPGTTTSPTTAEPYSGSTDFGGGGSSNPSFGGSTGGSISDLGPVTPTTVATTPTTATTIAQVDPFQPPQLAAGATPGGGGGADQPWARLLFLVPLAAAAGVGSVYLRRLLAERGVVEA